MPLLALFALQLCAKDDPAVFKSDVAMTRVDAQVLDRNGRAITGLHNGNNVYSIHSRNKILEEKVEGFVRQSRLFMTSLVLVIWTGIGTGRLAAQNNGGPPIEQDQFYPVTFEAGQACAFPIRLDAHGKAKTLTLPGERTVTTSPGLHVTITNLNDTSKQLQNINVTGASHTTTEPDGSMVVTFTGRNLNGDPVAGFVLAIGRFSIVFDANGKLTQPLQGKGQLIDVCALIE